MKYSTNNLFLKNKAMKKVFALCMLALAMMIAGVQSSFAKKVLVCTNGASTYHTWSKCSDLKSCGLSAKVNEKDAKKEGKVFCSICERHEADVAAEKAQKKAEKAKKKAENKVKKAEKAQKKAEKEAKKMQKVQENAIKQIQDLR